MNKEKRREILKILESGWSSSVISMGIGNILNKPESDILRILNFSDWNNKKIMGLFFYCP